MNATQWETSANPLLTIDSLGEKMSDRQLKLFTAACCRRVKPMTEEAEIAIKIIEAEADGHFDPSYRDRVCDLIVMDTIDPSSSATLAGVVNVRMLEILLEKSSLEAARAAISLASTSAS
jgi:hypothetical protein